MNAISSILIDGYNLIGISHNDLNSQRERLIRLLGEYRERKGHEIILVFDGWKSGGAREESLKECGVRVIYTRLGEKADHVIKRIISSQRKELIVVSSDREIAAFAWASGSVPVPSDRFLSAIERIRTAADERNDSSDNEDDEEPFRKKGNPRTPSRKEKALLRALRKL